VLGFLAIGPVLACIFAVVAIRTRAHPAVAAMTSLCVLTFGAPAFFIASFGPGMALADTFLIAGGLALPGVASFYGASALTASVLVVGAIVASRGSRSAARPDTV
jgi:hypothetical protein